MNNGMGGPGGPMGGGNPGMNCQILREKKECVGRDLLYDIIRIQSSDHDLFLGFF